MSTDDFTLAASIWNGDKFLLEAATSSGARQMKVTAEVVRAYLQGRDGTATDRRVLAFRGFIASAQILQASAAEGVLGFDVWFIRSEARFAATPRTGELLAAPPAKVYDNWAQRADYLDGRTPLAGNLYICADDSRPYWWTGAELRPIVTDTTGQVIADSIPLADIDAITAAPATQQAEEAAAETAATQSTDEGAAHWERVVSDPRQNNDTTAATVTTQQAATLSTDEGAAHWERVVSDPRQNNDTTAFTAATVTTQQATAEEEAEAAPTRATVTAVTRAAVIEDLTKRRAAVTAITRAARVEQAVPRARLIVVG